MAAKNPGIRFIVQEFHEKVYVDVEASPATDVKVVTTMEKDMKKAWVGIVNNDIRFFNSNPVGTVDGLEASKEFSYGDNQLCDPNGNNLLQSAEAGHGTSNAGSIEQSMDNQTSQTQTPTPTA